MKNSFISGYLNKYVLIGDSLSLEERYRFYVYLIFCAILVPIFAGFSIFNFYRGIHIQAALDLWIALAIFFSFILILFINSRSRLFLGMYILLFTLLSYLFMSGFDNGSGMLWMYTLPVAGLFLMGVRRAYLFISISYLLFFLTFLRIDIFPFALYPYTNEIKLRFLVSYSFIVMMATIYETLRQRFQTELEINKEELHKEKEELQIALENIKTLSGLLPICAHCKNVRDDAGYWHRVESYIEKHSHAVFSHGICPVCLKKYYPDSNQGND